MSEKPMSEKPDLIITNGKWISDGSGGNSHYNSKKDAYLYMNVTLLLLAHLILLRRY
jgi:hypothetical protein